MEVQEPVSTSTPSFAQPERRSFAVPILIALAVLGCAIALGIHLFPHTTVQAEQVRTDYLPTHTVFKADTLVIGKNHDEDVLFVAETVKLTNRLRFAVTLDNFTCTLTDATGAEMTVAAAQKFDLPNIETSFPALAPLMATPLVRESTLAPGASASGTILLSFPFTPEQWAARRSAVLTIALYHQEPVSVVIAK